MNKVKFTTTIDRELLEKLKIAAIKEKCSASFILEKLIREYLSNKEGN